MGIAPAAHPDERWMARALELASRAEAAGEVPVGAVLVHGDIAVGEGFNRPIAAHDPTAHAEIEAIRAAAQSLGNYRLAGTTLYVTMEPCPMCAGAIVHARIERVVFGAADFRLGAAGTVFNVMADPAVNHRPAICGGVLETRCRDMLQIFFAARRSGA